MSDIALDNTTGEIELLENDLFLTSGAAGIQQHLTQRLRTFLEEWFLDFRIGVPWFQQVFRKDYDPVVVDAAIKGEIVNTQGIEELVSFNLEIVTATRQLSVSFQARTIEGDVITFEEVLP